MQVLVTAMRQAARSVEVAQCAVRHRDEGVVGFDIAGPEKGYPPTRYLEAFDYVRPHEFPHHDPRRRVVRAAVDLGGAPFCGAERLGHGVRIVDDIHVRDDGSVELGRLAAFVRDRRVPLECARPPMCTRARPPSIREHPIDLLRRLKFRVTLNTDNRLISGVSMSSEFAALDEAFGIGLGEMEWMTINSMKSAFAPFDERLRIINEVVKPGYARLRARGVVGSSRSDDRRVSAGRPVPSFTPKIILEGTRLTHKTDLAFALNEHPRIVGPRKYRYHSPLGQRGVVRVHALRRGVAG